MGFEVRFEDETTTQVLDADAYEQEGPLTTFFDRNGGGGLASAFALRVASFRTSRIVEIRRVDLAPVARVTAWDTVTPMFRLEEHYMPNAGRIAAAGRKVLEYQ